MSDDATLQTATFGAGCFWGVEAAFREIDGVVDAAVGYSGGNTEDPTYKDVCRGDTAHAEVVQVRFDPARVTYEQLLELFWSIHNPTTLNRQGPDVGSQYRSAVFTHSADQQASAEASVQEQEANGRYRKPIVTQIAPASTFYAAEEHHQQYLAKRGMPSCHLPNQ